MRMIAQAKFDDAHAFDFASAMHSATTSVHAKIFSTICRASGVRTLESSKNERISAK